MSTPTDTPQTDEEWQKVESGQCLPSCDSHWHGKNCPVAHADSLMADFARRLERERDEARRQLKEARRLAANLGRALNPHFVEMERRCIEADLRGLHQTAKRARARPQYVAAKKALAALTKREGQP